jgi:precorrin-3B methylase
MTGKKMISFDRPRLNNLKKAYSAAQTEGKGKDDTFVFDGDTYVLGYAKYVIEYLDDQLPK